MDSPSNVERVAAPDDLNVTATKYFYALKDGEVPLLFLFSGTVFYAGVDGKLQVQRVSWDRECAYRMPVRVWQELMEHHYPGSAWLSLHRHVFERLYAYKLDHGIPAQDLLIGVARSLKYLIPIGNIYFCCHGFEIG